MSDNWTRASLRLSSRVANAEDVTKALGVEPSEVRDRHTGEYVWVLDSGLPASTAADEHVESILERLRPNLRALNGFPGGADIFLGFASENGQGGMVLHAALLGELAQYGIDLVLDLYPPEASVSDLSD